MTAGMDDIARPTIDDLIPEVMGDTSGNSNQSVPSRGSSTEFAHQFWHVQRLLFVAVKKESTITCAMAKIPQSFFKWVVHEITDYLCTPPHVHSHPSTVWACKTCLCEHEHCKASAWECTETAEA